jgi:hypothetical protein
MEKKNSYNEKKKHKKKMLILQSEINSKFENIKINCPDLKSFENLKLKIMGKVVSSKSFRDKKKRQNPRKNFKFRSK